MSPASARSSTLADADDRRLGHGGCRSSSARAAQAQRTNGSGWDVERRARRRVIALACCVLDDHLVLVVVDGSERVVAAQLRATRARTSGDSFDRRRPFASAPVIATWCTGTGRLDVMPAAARASGVITSCRSSTFSWVNTHDPVGLGTRGEVRPSRHPGRVAARQSVDRARRASGDPSGRMAGPAGAGRPSTSDRPPNRPLRSFGWPRRLGSGPTFIHLRVPQRRPPLGCERLVNLPGAGPPSGLGSWGNVDGEAADRFEAGQRALPGRATAARRGRQSS